MAEMVAGGTGAVVLVVGSANGRSSALEPTYATKIALVTNVPATDKSTSIEAARGIRASTVARTGDFAPTAPGPVARFHPGGTAGLAPPATPWKYVTSGAHGSPISSGAPIPKPKRQSSTTYA